MKVLIKQAIVICSSSPFNGQTKDILIDNGVITTIADSIEIASAQVIDKPGLHVSIGWMDIFSNFADPGMEYRETVQTGAAAAAAGGFTDVMLIPNTQPVVHSKSQVEYLVQQANTLAVNLHPIAAVTKNAEGKELSEMYDMRQSGAVAFSDGINSIQHAGLLLKALQYIKPFDGTIIQLPEDKSIGANGLINEGIVSTRLGLPGKPAMAEELIIERDIKLAQYSNSKLHITGVSSAASLEHIKKAKAAGVAVTCSVTPYHLFFCDEDLQQYDTNLKVNPPLRTAADRDALMTGFINGDIDCIASHHLPHHTDSKVCEFEYAKYGMIGLESLFGAVWSRVNGKWSIEKLIDVLTVSPRKIFGLAVPEISEGAAASLTLFQPSEEYAFNKEMIRSKSANSAYIGKQLKGKVTGILNKKQVVLND